MLHRPMRAGIRLLAVVLLVAGCQSPTPSASPSPSASESPSVSPSVQPSATDSGPAAWEETGSFNDTGGFSLVIDFARSDDVVVAVGTQYVAPLPNFGLPPDHSGRVWISTDGTEWEDVTQPGFEGVSLNQVLVTTDGGFVAVGSGPTARLWESLEGEAWTEIASPFPANSFVSALVSGAQGNLALVEGPARQLWYSQDGLAWVATYPLADQVVSIGAGDEGFVAAGAGFAIASSDGTNWFPGAAPPSPQAGTVFVAPVAGDWYAMESGQTASGFAATAPIWLSANGLDWAASGSMPITEVQADPTTSCHEFVTALHGSTPWLVATSRLSFPCSEGGFVVHGTQRGSTDGTTWTDLPFSAGTVGVTGSGSGIFATETVNGRLILGGQSNRAATFWIGPPP
jgi:hypothetical protein